MTRPAAGSILGRPVTRREDRRLLRGEGRFLDDLRPPGALHLAFVRSPHAHARIEAVHAPARGDGLVAVLTARDLDGLRPLPVGGPGDAEVADVPHPLLAGAQACYAGQPVAAVVARSRALAEDAAERVEVDYHELPAVLDARSAPETLVRWRRSGGDVDAAFARADDVVRSAHAIPRLAGAPLEPRGATARVEADGRLTFWCSAQDTQRPLAQLCHVLGLERSRVRTVVPDVGGAFGIKGSLTAELALTAVAAMRLGEPVTWVEDRRENLAGPYQGRGVEGEVELALDRDGRILALRARVWCDLGAFLLPTTAFPPRIVGGLLTGCYDVAAAEVEVVGARTNRVPTGPYRGAGRPEAAFLIERAVDAAARQLGADPLQLRRRNLVRAFPHRTPLGADYDSGDYARCLELAAELVGLGNGGGDDGGACAVGTGFAAYVETCGGMWEQAEALLTDGGRVVLALGTCPHGQGHETTFAQVAADRLGAALEDVELRWGDSDVVPGGVGTYSSRSVAMGGSALVLALDDLCERSRPVAARLLDVEPDTLRWKAGGWWSRGGGFVSLADLAAVAPGLRGAGRFASDPVYSSGVTAAVVAIERATGRLRVRRIAAVDDAGTIVNPLLAEGQVLGGTVQGLGAVLCEQVVHDAGGVVRSDSLASYRLPAAADVPPIAMRFVQTPSPRNPLGAKGIGEAGAIGTPAAIANAVADALGGAHVDPPFTARKLWRALQETAR